MPIAVFSERYALERELARGGMADVYYARDELLDRGVAVKVLFAEFARDPSFVERFRREAQAAGNLNHPNIVAIYDWGQEHGTYFIVMEYVEGRSLRDLIKQQGALAPAQAAQIASDTAGALAYAHRNGVVHRDVKPGNVLITASGQVKVTDLGIARFGTSEALTQTGNVMGTATYFSPEQAQGLPVDARSDVYSLGIVLYEMVTGVAPFQGDSPIAIAYKHVREEPVSPSDRNPDLPPDLDRIIGTAMAKDPANRYQSADDLKADLVRFLRGQPVAGGPVTGLLADVTTAGAAGAAGVGAAAGADPTLAQTIPPRDPGIPPRHAGTRKWPAFVVTAVLAIALIGGIGYLILKTTSDEEKAAGTARVPDVVNRQVDDARNLVEKRGFEVAIQRRPNAKVAENVVYKQIPDAGELLEKGEKVTLYVSSGAPEIEVPDVQGLTEEDAKRLIEDAGFTYEAAIEFSDTVEPGRVIRTEPAIGKKAPEGSTVTVTYSFGSEPLLVPDVTGLDLDTATQQLSADFRVRTTNEVNDLVPQGNVIRTEPAAGEKAARDSTITVVISSGPEKATVPNVVGETETSARSILTGAGFQVQVSYVPVSPANDGKVISQSPSGGSSAPKSSIVQLTVGQGTTSTSSGTSTT